MYTYAVFVQNAAGNTDAVFCRAKDQTDAEQTAAVCYPEWKVLGGSLIPFNLEDYLDGKRESRYFKIAVTVHPVPVTK